MAYVMTDAINLTYIGLPELCSFDVIGVAFFPGASTRFVAITELGMDKVALVAVFASVSLIPVLNVFEAQLRMIKFTCLALSSVLTTSAKVELTSWFIW